MDTTTKPKYEYFVGTKSQFTRLVELGRIKDSYIIFISDTSEIYKGVQRYSADNLSIVNSKPEDPRTDVLYLINGSLMVYNTVDGWAEISKKISVRIDENSDHTTVPTSGAVYQAIKDAISKIDGSGDISANFQTKDTLSIKFSVNNNTLSADVKVSSDPNNNLSIRDDGLYIDTVTNTEFVTVVGDIPEDMSIKEYIDSKASTAGSVIEF